jgi:EAL domain-containing protein (putative c-di-GMP-specific phosphodiesterase class I)
LLQRPLLDLWISILLASPNNSKKLAQHLTFFKQFGPAETFGAYYSTTGNFILDSIWQQCISCLETEISEQQLIGDPSYLHESVKRLKEAGVHIAIDDVGFGNSCLESLILLEPNIIKIDKRIIIGISTQTMLVRSLRRLLKLAASLDIEVIAEGVENREDLAVIRDLGVKYAQGFLWGKPKPVSEITPPA